MSRVAGARAPTQPQSPGLSPPLRRPLLRRWPDELGVVPLVLLGVAAGEPAESVGELPALADVAANGLGIARTGVGPGQRLAARGGELDERGPTSSMLGMIFMSRNWRT